MFTTPILKFSSSWLVLSLLVFEFLTGCDRLNRQQPKSQTNGIIKGDRPQVVVTNTVLCDLTKQIAANTVEVVCLLPPGIDPHLYKLTPAARQSIEDANLILDGGYGLEPELIKAISATANPAQKIAVHELAVPQPQKFTEDGKSAIDPHVWHNAQHGVKLAEIIGVNLAKLVPSNATIYQQNTQKLITQLIQIDTWIKSNLATIPVAKRVLFTTHNALGYYAQAYGIRVDALEGLSTQEKPNAARAREIVDRIRQAQVSTIFAELSLNPQLINTIANEAKVKLSSQQICADGLGEAGSPCDTYQKMLISNTQTIVEGLGGNFTPFTLK